MKIQLCTVVFLSIGFVSASPKGFQSLINKALNNKILKELVGGKTSEWKNSILDVFSERNPCRDCEKVYADVTSMLQDGKTNRDVEVFLHDLLCGLTKSSSLREVCEIVVTGYIPQLTSFVANYKQPDEFCAMTNLCRPDFRIELERLLSEMEKYFKMLEDLYKMIL